MTTYTIVVKTTNKSHTYTTCSQEAKNKIVDKEKKKDKVIEIFVNKALVYRNSILDDEGL